MSLRAGLNLIEDKPAHTEAEFRETLERFINQRFGGFPSREHLEQLASAVPIPQDKPSALWTPQERDARIAQLMLKAMC